MARKKREEHEEHENHERWLITYADMITLLMVLFIVLYAISQVDLAKFQKFSKGVRQSFGGKTEQGVLEGGQTLVNGDGSINIALLQAANTALSQQKAQDDAAAADRQTLIDTQARLVKTLQVAGLKSDVEFRQEARGLVVSIVTDQVIFPSGSGDLTEAGRSLIGKLATSLAQIPNELSIEGHTDNMPIVGRYRSNWELSTARATSVLQELLNQHGIAPGRLSAAGYGDTHPVADNRTAVGRSANRRVEIVVHSTAQGGTP